jgi:hypothetical protein
MTDVFAGCGGGYDSFLIIPKRDEAIRANRKTILVNLSFVPDQKWERYAKKGIVTKLWGYLASLQDTHQTRAGATPTPVSDGRRV